MSKEPNYRVDKKAMQIFFFIFAFENENEKLK